MLKFTMDRKEIILTPIYDKGTVDQALIYGEDVFFGDNPDTKKHPLANYSCPAIFVIAQSKAGKNGYYILTDAYGQTIKLPHASSCNQYLYDAQKWLVWNKMREDQAIHITNCKIKDLEEHNEILARYAYCN